MYFKMVQTHSFKHCGEESPFGAVFVVKGVFSCVSLCIKRVQVCSFLAKALSSAEQKSVTRCSERRSVHARLVGFKLFLSTIRLMLHSAVLFSDRQKNLKTSVLI